MGWRELLGVADDVPVVTVVARDVGPVRQEAGTLAEPDAVPATDGPPDARDIAGAAATESRTHRTIPTEPTQPIPDRGFVPCVGFVRANRDANDASGSVDGAPEPAADLARGRRLLGKLRWTGRRIELAPDGALVVRPRLGTADLFGREVAAHPDDIAAALAAETAGAVA